jgi:predicted metal-dependent hydrolase
MTELPIRRIAFDFTDGDVPFLWNPENPWFSVQMNITSLIAIAFEKYIVVAVNEALPLIRDRDIAAEAEAFMRQEGQHSRAHRQHFAALIAKYPGLEQTVEDAVACYDRLLEKRSLKYHLAYIADLEAAFTPTFKLFLDHEDVLFRPGDDRVASMLLWHFTEEVEHRSSGLRLYRAFGGEAYRTAVLPSVLWHINGLLRVIAEGFNEHVPFEDRGVDVTALVPTVGLRQGFKQKVPWLREDPASLPGVSLEFIPKHERKTAARRVMRAQLPGHDPEFQPLPEFADVWMQRYDAGDSVGHWYASTPND